MVVARDSERIGRDLESLLDAIETVDIGPEPAQEAAERHRLATTIRSYLLPRLDDPTIPLTVVLAGPTGSGKSTLINSLAGSDLSETGPLRPTTTRPVALTSDANVAMATDLGGLSCEVVVGAARILSTMILVDTPDIDSTATDHRVMTETLIDCADVVVYVTSAIRYADDVAWQVLRRAESRGAEVLHVLNRVGSHSSGAVVDFQARLTRSGVDDGVIVIPEHHLPADRHRVPSLAVRSLRRRLATVAADRETTIRATTSRVLDVTLRQVDDLLRAIENRVGEGEDARETVDA